MKIAVLTGAVALAAASLAIVAVPTTATAATIPKYLQKFANCPFNNPKVTLCLYSSTSSTTFDIGSTTVSSTTPSTISLGLIQKGATFKAVLPDNGTQALTSAPIPLPGGLTGIPGAPDSGPIAVTVTPQLVGTPVVSIVNLISESGAGLVLPLDILISNSLNLLGADCTIGDASSPVTLNLTTGTTDPPGPNTAISGTVGTVSSSGDGITSIKNMSLVDNAFAVPGTDNCGPDGVLDQILDTDKGLPSAAGSNTAILSGDSWTIAASTVRQYGG
ncbi:MAG: hypothetical protein WAM97_13810 [Acidimicrobiales bacterium]